MKTSIFDMTFVLPPMLEMTEVVKDMPSGTSRVGACRHTLLVSCVAQPACR
jgi:hypothetical protein